NLGARLNTKYHESAACYSPDGKYLYFVSDRPEGNRGGRDIYRLELDARTPAENLGPVINSPYDEEGHGYYSSDQPGGLGGKDIYRVTFLGSESAPVAASKAKPAAAKSTMPIAKPASTPAAATMAHVTILKGIVTDAPAVGPELRRVGAPDWLLIVFRKCEPAGRCGLRRAAAEQPTLRLELSGQGDATATADLRQQRAEAILAYLTSHGIARTRLSTAAISQPVASVASTPQPTSGSAAFRVVATTSN
nr:hypothetical protein [Tanacetum cinerariifolium]